MTASKPNPIAVIWVEGDGPEGRCSACLKDNVGVYCINIRGQITRLCERDLGVMTGEANKILRFRANEARRAVGRRSRK